jgi:hypothetical protein
MGSYSVRDQKTQKYGIYRPPLTGDEYGLGPASESYYLPVDQWVGCASDKPLICRSVMYKKKAVAIGVMFLVADEHDGLVCMRHRRGMHVIPTVNMLNYCHYKI